MALTDEELNARVADMRDRRIVGRAIQARQIEFERLANLSAQGETPSLDDYNNAANISYQPTSEELLGQMVEKATSAVTHCKKIYEDAAAYEATDPGKFKADKLQARADAAYAALEEVRAKLHGLTEKARTELEEAQQVLGYFEGR